MSDETDRRDREAVSWFSTRMLRKLKLNEDKPGWQSDPQVSLLNRIFEEAHELREALLASSSRYTGIFRGDHRRGR